MDERKSERRQQPVTMRDVARLANVSQSTVSRVLNGAEGRIPIGDETRQRVLEAVESLGYQPNLHAGSLRSQKTRMIAIMIADLSNPFYHPMVRAAQDIAAIHRYDVMIANSDHVLENEQHFVDSVIRRPVDGVIMVPIHLRDEDLDNFMRRTGAVLSVLGQHVRHPDVDVVYGTDDLTTYEVIKWLHQVKGHVQIGFIGVRGNISAAARRFAAYTSALKDVGLRAASSHIQLGDWSPDSGYACMQTILDGARPPTAVFVCNDLMAIGAMEAVQQRGLRIPEDIAIVGFDDIPAASWIRPRLTTIAQFPTEMGRQLATMLFDRLEGNFSDPGRRVEVPCRLIERESA
jgi:LacI family transcriptional regulator